MGFKVTAETSGRVNIKLVKGDTFTQNIKIYTEDLLRYVPTAEDKVTFSIWNKFTDTEPILSKELPIDTMIFTLSAEESDSFKYGNYVYSVKIEFADGTVDTFLSGTFAIVTAGGDL